MDPNQLPEEDEEGSTTFAVAPSFSLLDLSKEQAKNPNIEAIKTQMTGTLRAMREAFLCVNMMTDLLN